MLALSWADEVKCGNGRAPSCQGDVSRNLETCGPFVSWYRTGDAACPVTRARRGDSLRKPPASSARGLGRWRARNIPLRYSFLHKVDAGDEGVDAPGGVRIRRTGDGLALDHQVLEVNT